MTWGQYIYLQVVCFRDMGLAPPLRGRGSNYTIYLQVRSVKASKVAQGRERIHTGELGSRMVGRVSGSITSSFCEAVYLFVCACGNRAGQVIMISMNVFTSSLLPDSEPDGI